MIGRFRTAIYVFGIDFTDPENRDEAIRIVLAEDREVVSEIPIELDGMITDLI